MPAPGTKSGETPLALSVDAARLLGRWVLVTQRHGDGCAGGMGLGNVSIGTVERSLLAWLRESHPAIGAREGVAELLRECVERKLDLPPAALASLLQDLGRAIAHLEGSTAPRA